MNKIICLAIGVLPLCANAQNEVKWPNQFSAGSQMPEVRTADGRENNKENPHWGRSNIQLLRRSAPAYFDQFEEPSGSDRPNPREISNLIHGQSNLSPNTHDASDFIWIWGQFIDHDMSLTEAQEPHESFSIAIPAGDIFFDPQFTEQAEMDLSRSVYSYDFRGIRQQLNTITAYIDASNVYGSNSSRTNELRTLDGTGRLKVSPGNFLPLNANGFANAPASDRKDLYLAGDIRANEQVGLVAMHTLFVREHNQLANMIRSQSPGLSGDEIFQL